MDFQQEYDSFHNNYYIKIEKLIKNFLIVEKAKSRNVDIVFNELSNYLFSIVPNRFSVMGNTSLKELLQLFEKRNNLYENNHIHLIFTNEIKTGFDAIESSKLPLNYTLRKLFIEIAIISVIRDISHLLELNRKIFNLFYVSNDFTAFEIKEYKSLDIEDTSIYIALNQKVNPEHYTNPVSDYFLEEYEEKNDRPYSLPIVIALLNEVGFFELEKIKSLSPTSLAKIIAIIQSKDPNNKTTIRAISGNTRVLNPNNKEDGFKYTSHKHAQKVKILLNEIRQGNQ